MRILPGKHTRIYDIRLSVRPLLIRPYPRVNLNGILSYIILMDIIIELTIQQRCVELSCFKGSEDKYKI